MTIDDRLREAAWEARQAAAALDAPAPERARRAARWRAPLIGLAAAAVVAAAVAGVALLRPGGGTAPVTVAPAGPETASTVAEAVEVVPAVPAGTVEVPIVTADPEAAAAAVAVAEEAERLPAQVLGAVGDTVLLRVDQGGDVECLVTVDGPSATSDCGVGGPTLGFSISQLPDGSHRASVGGRLPAGGEVLVVTAGDVQYAQVARDGWVYVPFDATARPVRLEARAADGRVVAQRPVGAGAVEIVSDLLRLQLRARAEELRRNPDPLEQAVLDAQTKLLEGSIVAVGEAETLDDLLALAERRLDEARGQVVAAPPSAPPDGPVVIPVPEATAAALGSNTQTMAAGSARGPIWVAGALPVVDGAELPSLLFGVDAATGRLIGSYEVGPPMHHLAAGGARVWFGRAGDGALPSGAVGSLDLETGEVQVLETDLAVADVVLTDPSGALAYLLAQAGEAPVVARLAPGAAPAPMALDWDPAGLVAAASWPGGLLVADDAGTVWQIDASTETATRFADARGAAFALEPAAGGGVWALVWDDPDVRAVLFGADGEAAADHELAPDAVALASNGGDGAFALEQSGEVWFVAAGQPPALVVGVDPGSPETGFSGLARAGTGLWLLGGDAGLTWVELGQ